MPSVIVDYQSYIEERVSVDDGECWLWQRALNRLGYGSIHLSNYYLAHRLSYELFSGSLIPAELEIDHLCRTPRCVNPDHLEAVPHAINILRGNGGIVQRQRTACPLGHPYTLRKDTGKRRCRTCENAAKRRSREQSRG